MVDNLAGNGYKVRAFDIYSHPPQFLQHENVEVVKGDLFNLEELKQVLSGVDYVLHSFSATTPFSSDEDPLSDVEKNLAHNIKMFRLFVDLDIKKVIFISSGGAVYGTATEADTVDETTMPTPVSPYGICKLATEHYLEYFKRKYGLDYVVYRLTNPYGPRQIIKQNQGFIPALLDNMSHDREVTIFGDGSMSRDYIYIPDAIEMITASFDKECRHSTYNIGSGHQTDLRTILEVVQKLAGKDIKTVHKDAPKTFLQKTSISIDRYVSEFGRPQLTPIEEGLRSTLTDHK